MLTLFYVDQINPNCLKTFSRRLGKNFEKPLMRFTKAILSSPV